MLRSTSLGLLQINNIPEAIGISRAVAKTRIQRVRALRPNAAKMDKASLCSLDHLEEGDPIELGQQMSNLAERDPQINIWGGCCGT